MIDPNTALALSAGVGPASAGRPNFPKPRCSSQSANGYWCMFESRCLANWSSSFLLESLTWLEVGHYWQVTIDEEQMYLKQCLTYLYGTKLTHLLVCKRLGHYYTLQQLSYYSKPLAPSVFILLCAIIVFFLIIPHLHYLVYCLPSYSQIIHLL